MFVKVKNTNRLSGLFEIERQTGKLKVMKSLDREQVSKYLLKIRAEKILSHRGRRAVPGRYENVRLAFDETIVSIEVADENDNPPLFQNGDEKPIIAAVPLDASYGFEILKIKVGRSYRFCVVHC